MSSINGGYEVSPMSLDDLHAQFEAYEEGVRGSYLFVNVTPCQRVVSEDTESG